MGGTWEEKSVKVWARRRLAELIERLSGTRDRTTGVAVRVQKVRSVSGEADIIYSRNKRKDGIDLTAKIDIDVELQGKTLSGILRVEVANNNREEVPEFTLEWAGDSPSLDDNISIKGHLRKQFMPKMRDVVGAILDEMKAQ
uniref:Activator of Hsp90 ATPase AHSA1-like N-terminal domain-containing protein n=1 Tax=Lotharella oceanica TaxID=641309 RepID=A0A7S2U0Y2_9EUKA|mmetsp:Transcript_5195/g.10293  ORF Transcript_5195/g.10293 Transcript_5195/m.10293 type:complete len:142 (+) Transcript_5195:298-723(+)|eukprot:CAMPEP_0170185974 /NCGR_PEP_ID=MMETSP0040_2-20121228/37982_1 /TAXON_ID=641309 /ORGANISM="Lotharella oceanica, Strain CCMP622" /LENGTH=141 /DNA_ID=CAMNT_0010432545 /DNA_START=298 /DNA_END=723 /DNA_ORIENTATION=+